MTNYDPHHDARRRAGSGLAGGYLTMEREGRSMFKRLMIVSLAVGLGVVALMTAGCTDSEPTAKATWVLEVTANPATIDAGPGEQGQSTIIAVLFDENGRLKPGVGLRFSSNAGSMASGGNVITTDQRGEARDVLTLGSSETEATVKVKSGAVEGTTVVKIGELSPPTAGITIAPSGAARTGAGVTFSGASSEDLDGEIVKYVWSIVSNNPDDDKPNPEVVETTNQAIIRTYQKAQHLDVSLTVTDNDDLTDSDSEQYDIFANLPPVADAGPALEGTAGLSGKCTVRLNGCSSTDPDGHLVAYRWTFQTINETRFNTCTFDWPFDVNENGTLVTLTVFDNGDGSSQECNAPNIGTLDDCPTRKTDEDTTTVICHPAP